jgi:nucleoid-associated protein YgaU
LLLLILFLLFNFVCKKDTLLTEKKEVTPAVNEEQKEVKKEEKKDTANDVKNNKNEYVVKQYDTLSKISEEIYGDFRFWKDIYNANKDNIKNPKIIYPGQVFKIPEKKK